MKKHILIFAMVISILLPKEAAATFDFLKNIIGELKLSQEEVTGLADSYVTYEMSLQQKTSDSKQVNKIKKALSYVGQSAEYAYAAYSIWKGGYSEFYNTKLSNLQWPGIDASSDIGEYTTPQLKKQVVLSYFKVKHVDNDVQTTVANDETNNKLRIENLSVDYANGLAARKRLQNKTKDELKPDSEKGLSDTKNSGKDIRVLEWNYGVVMRRANHRWIDIVRFEASNISNTLQAKVNTIRLDDASEIIGENAEDAARELQKKGARVPESGSNGIFGKFGKDMTLGQVVNYIDRGLEALKSRDYSSAFNSLSDLYAGTPGYNETVAQTISKVSSKVKAGQEIRDDIENENYDDLSKEAYDKGKEIYEKQKEKQKEKEKEKEDDNKDE